MKKAARKCTLWVVRDFGQVTQELLRHEAVDVLSTVWGKGINDQIVHFTGRTFEMYRYADEAEALRDFVVHKHLDDTLFSNNNHKQFRKNIDTVRSYIAIKPTTISDPAAFFHNIVTMYDTFYPYYHISFLLPGAWREQFIAAHGTRAQNVLKILFDSRKHCEGVVKEVDLFLRTWIGALLKQHGYDKTYAQFLSIQEIEQLLEKNIVPKKTELARRAKGYVYIKNTIVPTRNFKQFFQQHNLTIDTVSVSKKVHTISGTVASSGGMIRGRVQTLFNSGETTQFKAGAILVTPMTSPEYLFAIKKAKAIITDEGGLSCHAAIVARELKKPCIIGTKIATKILKDGDLVEIDAQKGTITKMN